MFIHRRHPVKIAPSARRPRCAARLRVATARTDLFERFVK
jgi:hypothetical protein